MWVAEAPCLFRFVLVEEIPRNFVGVFNKTIIPLALVGYEVIIANSRWLSIIPYPTRLRGINICCRNSQGALVFWDPTGALSLDRVQKWLKDVKNKKSISLSINPVRSCHGQPFKEASTWSWRKVREWDGVWSILERSRAFKFRNWESGENSVFGQAVNCLIEKILCEQT